jgi:hypothetical protein
MCSYKVDNSESFIPEIIKQHELTYQFKDEITNYQSDEESLKTVVETLGLKTAKSLFEFKPDTKDPIYEGNHVLNTKVFAYTELIHDLCHYKLAAPTRRNMINFGLGEIGNGDNSAIIGNNEEELYVCALDIMYWLWHTIDREILSSKIGYLDYSFKEIARLCNDLNQMGFLNQDWQPTDKLNQCDDIIVNSKPTSWLFNKDH